MFEILTLIKNKLSEIENQNVAIGLESNLTANQCPFIRIITQPSRPATNSAFEEEAEIQILYGEKVNIKTNLEEVYEKIYETEKKIREKMKELESEDRIKEVNWVETIPDEDTLNNIKASASIFLIRFGDLRCR